MGPEGQLVLNLLISVGFGAIVAAIANSKGRNTIGWFFVGFLFSCIGLILILCMSNLREEEERWRRSQAEQRRLREQLRQERMKNEAFRGHVQGRLDLHDEALRMDTRQVVGEEAAPGLEAEQPSAPVTPESLRQREWYVNVGERQSRKVPFSRLKALYRAGRIDERTLVWTSGMETWRSILDVPGLLDELI